MTQSTEDVFKHSLESMASRIQWHMAHIPLNGVDITDDKNSAYLEHVLATDAIEHEWIVSDELREELSAINYYDEDDDDDDEADHYEGSG